MTERSKALRREYDVDSVLSVAADRVAAKKLVTGTRQPVYIAKTEDIAATIFAMNDLLASQDLAMAQAAKANAKSVEGHDFSDENTNSGNAILNWIKRHLKKEDTSTDTAVLFKKAYIRSKKRFK